MGFDETAAAEAGVAQEAGRRGEDGGEEVGHGVDLEGGVEDGAVGRLADEIVVFGLGAADGALAVGHGEEGIGGGCVAVGLVDDHMSALKQREILAEGAVFDDDEFATARMPFESYACGLLEAVGALRGEAPLVAAEKKAYFFGILRDVDLRGEGEVDGNPSVGYFFGGEPTREGQMILVEGRDGAADVRIDVLAMLGELG